MKRVLPILEEYSNGLKLAIVLSYLYISLHSTALGTQPHGTGFSAVACMQINGHWEASVGTLGQKLSPPAAVSLRVVPHVKVYKYPRYLHWQTNNSKQISKKVPKC